MAILNRWTVVKDSSTIDQLLIQWEGLSPEDVTWETLSNLEDKVEIEGGKDHTILPIVDMDSRDQTIQNTNNIKEMTPGLLPAEIELTVQELGTRITDERTRSSQRISKHPDWIHDFHLNAQEVWKVLCRYNVLEFGRGSTPSKFYILFHYSLSLTLPLSQEANLDINEVILLI